MTTPATGSTMEKDTMDMEADIGELPNKNSNESTTQKESISPKSQEHENIGMSFSQQLKDIDKDLGIYEDPLIQAQFEESQKNQENSPLFDLNTLRKDLDVNLGMSRAPTFVPPLENSPITPPLEISISPTPHINAAAPHQVTWKRIPRPVTGTQHPSSNPTASKRPIDRANDHCELPSKKLAISNNDRDNILSLAEAVAQPR